MSYACFILFHYRRLLWTQKFLQTCQWTLVNSSSLTSPKYFLLLNFSSLKILVFNWALQSGRWHRSMNVAALRTLPSFALSARMSALSKSHERAGTEFNSDHSANNASQVRLFCSPRDAPSAFIERCQRLPPIPITFFLLGKWMTVLPLSDIVSYSKKTCLSLFNGTAGAWIIRPSNLCNSLGARSQLHLKLIAAHLMRAN